MGEDVYIPPKPEYRYALWYFTYNKNTTPMKKNLMGR